MPIEYPSGLPGPQLAPLDPTEGRDLTDGYGPREARAFQRDRRATQRLQFKFTPEQVGAFNLWVETALVFGGCWFASPWRLPQGGIGVRRFIMETQQRAFLATGHWLITIDCEVRGCGALPEVTISGDMDLILRTIFAGADSTDTSPEDLGPGVLLGATITPGNLRLIANAGDGSSGTLQSLYWEDPVLVIQPGEPKTIEFFLDAAEIVSNPGAAARFLRILQVGDSTELVFDIEGNIGGINRLYFALLSSGTTTNSWTDTVDCLSAGRRHIAISIYDDPMAVENAVDLYVAGVLVHTLSYGQLTATTGRVQFQGGTQVAPDQMQIDIGGVRATNRRRYSGASFAPPSTF